MISNYFNNIAKEYYKEDLSKEAVFWRKYDIELILSFLPKEKDTFIDLGCGNGFYASKIVRLFKHSILIDSSKIMISNAKKILGEQCKSSSIDYIQKDFRKLDLLDTRFYSFVLANGSSLCYQKDSLSLLIPKICSELKVGGRFYFEVWNKAGLLINSRTLPMNFYDLRAGIKNLEIKKIVKYFSNGKTIEFFHDNSIKIWSYSLKEVLNLLNRIRFIKFLYFGRKAISLLYDPIELSNLILDKAELLYKFEEMLRVKQEFIQLCPKIIFIVERILK